MFASEKIADWCKGVWQGGIPDFINGFCIDTRLLQKGDIFVALSGDDRDGHDYLETAFAAGAAGAIVAASKVDAEKCEYPCLLVKDPATALKEIATGYRIAVAPVVIAVTGSAGKSTVKELIAQMLDESFKTAKTRGNWNNNIGLPLSILAMEENTEVAVFELGMNHPGEIDVLCNIAEPVCSVVTNVGPVHVEFFDTVKDIAEEKSVALRKLPSNGIAFLDSNGEFFEVLKKAVPCKVCTVSITGDADYYCINRDTEKNTITVHEKTSGNEVVLPMPLPGDFNVLNVLFAVGVARWMGVAWDVISRALQGYQSMPMRWSKVIVNDRIFINDAYNANPVSMRAAIETFYKEHKSDRKWLVLGGMLELGDCEKKEHIALGEFIAGLSWDGLIVVGRLGKLIAGGAENSGMNGDTVWCCDDCMAVTDLVRQHIEKDSAVLLKGSRGFKLEQVIDKLLT